MDQTNRRASHTFQLSARLGIPRDGPYCKYAVVIYYYFYCKKSLYLQPRGFRSSRDRYSPVVIHRWFHLWGPCRRHKWLLHLHRSYSRYHQYRGYIHTGRLSMSDRCQHICNHIHRDVQLGSFLWKYEGSKRVVLMYEWIPIKWSFGQNWFKFTQMCFSK